MELTLSSPVQYIPRIGPLMAKRLEKLDIVTVYDLLMYPPFRYNDFSRVCPIAHVQPEETVTITGTVLSFANVRTKKGKPMQIARVADETGTIEIIWFNQPYLINIIKKGELLRAAGAVGWFARKIVMTSPDYEIVTDENASSLHTGRLVAVYSETHGVSSKWLRGRIDYCLAQGFAQKVIDRIPQEIRTTWNLLPVSEAIRKLHFPEVTEEASDAKLRFAFEELFLLQVTALMQQMYWRKHLHAEPVSIEHSAIKQFETTLPFTLTDDQKNATQDLLRDLTREYPMNRLLIGDVGVGKTVVAAGAMYAMHLAHRQSVLMAPTQILAEQHYQSIQKLLAPFGIQVNLVTGEKKVDNSSLFDQSPVVVGTHALLSDHISLDTLGLVVIDEQQRFGVKQRTILRNKSKTGYTPHLLTMTATPIPRTIALSCFGNLDVSEIRTTPSGRLPIKTWVVPKEKREKAYAWINAQIETHHSQTFIVCPLIDESDAKQEVKSVTVEFERLSSSVFKKRRLALLHGKLKPKEKTAVLESFRNGEYDILVTTPVVEVGIDIPDATIMMIEGADRFGLSQLHQLRGRVGRRNQQAYCLLFTESEEESVINRLLYLEKIHNGPELAEADFVLRGPGDLFGSRQHGLVHLRFADFMNIHLLEETQKAAKLVITQDPELIHSPLLREILDQSIIQSTLD